MNKQKAPAPYSVGRRLSFPHRQAGGGMLLFCAFVLSMMALSGSLSTNYAWREAQTEELRAAMRAAVSSAGPLLGTIASGVSAKAVVVSRIGSFVSGLLPALKLGTIDIDYDAATGITTVSLTGDYGFREIWITDTASSASTEIAETVSVQFTTDQYEVGLALDLSSSMARQMPDGAGGSIVKLDALKNAMHAIVGIMAQVGTTDPGAMMASIVPFGTAVNVADTCNPDPGTGLCRADRSPGKERYLRMLAGTDASMSNTLANARARGYQWVDMYHHYGATEDLGPLAMLALPDDLLSDTNWDLRHAYEIDLGSQAPNIDTNAPSGRGYWAVNGEDFWNGCVMARWGAYWDPAARPVGWVANDPRYWPVVGDVPGWSAAASPLLATPLHLSDAPPDANDPHSLFTAYSWPDARISRNADYIVQSVMLDLLGAMPGYLIPTVRSVLGSGDNDWSIREDYGGAAQCPHSPIIPLSDDYAALDKASSDLDVVLQHVNSRGATSSSGGTNLALGMTWALRTLSPLWRDVWDVHDAATRPRPSIPCQPGESPVSCNPLLHKSILLISDGSNWPGRVNWRLLTDKNDGKNPSTAFSTFGSWCRSASRFPTYTPAATETSESAFNAHFAGLLDANELFDGAGAETVANAFHRIADSDYTTGSSIDPNPVRLAFRAAALTGLSPWSVFRGVGDASGMRALTDSTDPFELRGRPVLSDHLCQRSGHFSAYGRPADRIRTGGASIMPYGPLPPLQDAAPFGDSYDGQSDNDVVSAQNALMDSWFYAACDLAGQRGVRVNAVYIGETSHSTLIRKLQECVRRANGEPLADVYVVPTAQALNDTLVGLFTVRRTLTFLD